MEKEAGDASLGRLSVAAVMAQRGLGGASVDQMTNVCSLCESAMTAPPAGGAITRLVCAVAWRFLPGVCGGELLLG